MSRRNRVLALAAAAVGALALASTLSVAAATGAFSDHRGTPAVAGCRAPALLPGAEVSVRLLDMRSMMLRRPMTAHRPMMGGPVTGRSLMSHGLMPGPRAGRMMSQRDWRWFRRGMMRVVATPTSVPHGVVSLRVRNGGYLTHELVVLPLSHGSRAGSRVPRPDGTVSEAGSLGEASASCTAGPGDGIVAGATGWVTLHLPAGRYELICNLPGHYAAGMYAELRVT